MLRSLVTTYLIVATLLGPRPCPCPAAPAGTASSTPVSPAKGESRSCGCCTPVGSIGTVVREAGGQRPESPSAPCQCQCGKQDSATARVGGRAGPATVGNDGLPVPCHGFASVELRAVPQHVSCGGPLRDRPLCSTHDLLYVFHRLRC